MKTYAQAVDGKSSVNQSWTHLQTQCEEEAIILALRNSLEIQVLHNGKVQNMDPWSMDPLRGPGPWTGSIEIWTGSMDPLIMDRVHGPPIFTS